ncbi:MAG: Lrp/AsnC family transcriptional regulator [Gammaproteobacteria bacterium]
MDRIDLRILGYLQRDATLSLHELAERVSLSKNPCWRRVQKLQQQGYIKKQVAVLDPGKLNLGVTVFVNVRTNQHSADWLKRFAEVVNAIPEVVEFYRMSGNVDYMLKIVVPTIEAYDAVYKKMISNIDIYDVSSYFAMEELKNTTELPLNYL